MPTRLRRFRYAYTERTATSYVPSHTRQGTRGDQPDASAVRPGTLYSVTDEGNRIEWSDGTTWHLYSPPPGGGDAAAGYWTPITNGDPLSPELLFDANAECVVGFVPTP